MKRFVTTVAVLALATLGAGTGTAWADDDPEEVGELVEGLQEKCDQFEEVAADELDDSILKGTRIESAIKEAIGKLAATIGELEKEFDDDDDLSETRDEARTVQGAAKDVESALDDITRESETWEKWRDLADEIDELAEAYDLDEQDEKKNEKRDEDDKG
jgi:hypothetical protein